MLTKTDLPLYLDAASTTPVHPEVLEAMLPYFTEHFGNPNSQHIYGQIAKKAIDDARQSIADHINVSPEEIIFTSGATEAINLAIKGYWEANRDKGNHIITVKTEHKAVLNTCAYLETLGVDVTYLDVDHYGRITNEELRAAFRPDTILACVMHVNNETGLIQDVHSFAEICAEEGVAFFTDSTQAVGHIETDYSNPAISMACLSGHKIGGPKGIGALVKRQAINIAPMLHGGQQEGGLRSGTMNTAGIIGLNVACVLAKTNEQTIKRRRKSILREFSILHGASAFLADSDSAPHILCFISEEQSAAEFVRNHQSSYSVSIGSACESSLMINSHVYEALGTANLNMFRISIS